MSASRNETVREFKAIIHSTQDNDLSAMDHNNDLSAMGYNNDLSPGNVLICSLNSWARARIRSLIDQFMPQGEFDQAYGIIDAQLGDEVFPVCLDRADAKE